MRAVVLGAREAEGVAEVVGAVKDRTGGRGLDLVTSDDYPAYATAWREAYGREITTTATDRPSRTMVPEKGPPPGMSSATVQKRRAKDRGVEVLTRVVLGTRAAVPAAVARSKVSRWINVSFWERPKATDRHPNARKVRTTSTFSQDGRGHEAMTSFPMSSDHFGWPVRTLTERDDEGHRRRQTPALAAGWADPVGTMREWITPPGVQRR